MNPMSRSLQALAVICLFTVLSGCNADILDLRKKDDTKPAFQNPNGAAQTQSPATTNTNPAITPDSDPANLPPYLLKRDQALGLKPFVEAYVLPVGIPDSPVTNASSNFPALVTGVSDFFVGLFAKPSTQPGRTMKVYVIDDTTLNASCDGFQKVRLNTGLVKIKNSALTTLVLCHEIAHSARNHVAKRIPLAEQVFGTTAKPNTEMDAIDAAINAYMAKQFNSTQGVYTHKKSEFDPLLKRFKAHVSDYEIQSKRHESEADVLGSFLCAQTGMKAAEWLAAYQSFLKAGEAESSGGIRDGSQVPDGGQLKVTAAELNSFITDFLFSIDSHPSDQERLDQFKRLNDLMAKELDGGSKTYSDLVGKLNTAAGASLYDAPLSDEDLGIKRYPSLNGGPDVIIRRPFDHQGRSPAFRFR